MRQSQGTNDDQNPYSDFEDDDEQAAVGSGVVETNENYGEDYGDDVSEDIAIE